MIKMCIATYHLELFREINIKLYTLLILKIIMYFVASINFVS